MLGLGEKKDEAPAKETAAKAAPAAPAPKSSEGDKKAQAAQASFAEAQQAQVDKVEEVEEKAADFKEESKHVLTGGRDSHHDLLPENPVQVVTDHEAKVYGKVLPGPETEVDKDRAVDLK